MMAMELERMMTMDSLIRSKSVVTAPHFKKSSRKQPRPITVATMPNGEPSYDTTSCLRLERAHSRAASRHFKRSPVPTTTEDSDVYNVSGAGFTVVRSRKNLNVLVKTDEIHATRSQATPGASQMQSRVSSSHQLVIQLQAQIHELEARLEEELFLHKQTKLHSDEHLKDRSAQIESKYEREIRLISGEYEKKLEDQRQYYELELETTRHQLQSQITQMKQDGDVLNAAFVAYKSQAFDEVALEWKKKEEQLALLKEKEYSLLLQEQDAKHQQEMSSQRSALQAEFEEKLTKMKEENQKQMKECQRQIAIGVEAQKELTQLRLMHNHLKEEMEEGKTNLQQSERMTRRLKIELSEAKITVANLQQNFDSKVNAVEQGFVSSMNELRLEKGDLRRRLWEKVDEMERERTLFEPALEKRAFTAKETMNEIVDSRNRTMTSLISTFRDKLPKQRPSSAPTTPQEAVKAVQHSGETDAVLHQRRDQFYERMPRPPLESLD